jgi:fructose-1,6-bisphosphatase/inositol monophosphatase family enzyme
MESSSFSKGDIASLQEIGIVALKNAGHIHDSLGKAGEERIPTKNQFNQTAYRADIECEEAIFKTFERYGISVLFDSEEHEEYLVGSNPKLFAPTDGLDGTNRYIAGRGTLRYGTTFGLYDGLDPNYSDYIFGGIIVHSTKQIFYAGRDMGAFEMNANGISVPIKTSSTTEVDPQITRLYADTLYDEEYKIDVITSKLKKNFADFDIQCLRAACIHLADLVSGKVDAVIESTRKGNLEIGAAFGIINEAGGVILDISGHNLKNEKFRSYGQREDIPIVDAANLELAQKLVAKLST